MFFWGGGLWATSTDPFNPPKKTKKPNTNQKKTTHTTEKKTKEIQYNKKQKPQHNNLISETTTTRTKKNTEIQNQQKERPTQENKGSECKCKKPKNLQKNSVVFETSPLSFCNKTLLRTSKTPMCTISDPLFVVSMSHLALVAEQPKPDYCIKIVVSEFFFLFFCSLPVVHKTVCTIFAQLVFHPKNRAQKRALFPKTTLPYKNSGLRPKRAPKNH